MDVVTLGILAYFLGGVLSVLYPYLVAYLESGESFDYRYAISRVIAVVVAGLGAIVVPGFVEWLQELSTLYDYTALYFLAVVISTYGAGAIGRQTQKLGTALKTKSEN